MPEEQGTDSHLAVGLDIIVIHIGLTGEIGSVVLVIYYSKRKSVV